MLRGVLAPPPDSPPASLRRRSRRSDRWSIHISRVDRWGLLRHADSSSGGDSLAARPSRWWPHRHSEARPAARRSVDRGGVDCQEEERRRAGVPGVVPDAGRDQDQRAWTRDESLRPYPQLGLALEHVDDLIAGVLLLGAGVLAGGHGHHRRLAGGRGLQDAEEVASIL